MSVGQDVGKPYIADLGRTIAGQQDIWSFEILHHRPKHGNQPGLGVIISSLTYKIFTSLCRIPFSLHLQGRFSICFGDTICGYNLETPIEKSRELWNTGTEKEEVHPQGLGGWGLGAHKMDKIVAVKEV